METEELIGMAAFDFVLRSVNGIDYKMRDLSKDGVILIFNETGCPVCNPLLEKFLNSIQDHPSIRYAIIEKESGGKSAFEVSELFSDEVFLIGDEEIFNKYRITYKPTYVYINKHQIIEHVSLNHDIILDKLLKRMKSA